MEKFKMGNNNEYGIRDKIKKGIVYSITSLILAAGCGELSQRDITLRETQSGKIQRERDPKKIEEVARGLGYSPFVPPMLSYSILKFGEFCVEDGVYNNVLTNIAGVYAGTVQVDKDTTEGGGRSYLPIGVYEYSKNPEALHKALAEADTNGDKIVTNNEALDLEFKVFEQFGN